MILVGGENLIDFIQEKNAAGYPVYRAIPGGSPYNVAKTMARQKVSTGYLTPVSNDSLGDLLRDELRADGVTFLSPRSPKPTSLAVVSLMGGQPAYQFYRENTAERDISARSLSNAMPDNARGFYIGSLAITDGPDAAIWESAWISAHQRGIFTAIDPNIRAAFIRDRSAYLARLERMMAKADLIKLSDEDLTWLSPDTEIFEAAQQLFERSHTALLVLTLGSKGAVGFTPRGQINIKAARAHELQDTVGAGDTFMGTLLAQIDAQGLLGKSALAAADTHKIRAILETAAKAAAINCGRVGCDPPDLTEL